MDDVFTAEDFAEAEDFPTLGPDYFAARRFMDGFTAGWTDEHLAPLAETISKAVSEQIRDKVWDDFKDYLLQNTQYNAAGEIRHMVEGTVTALLSGNEWAMKRFPLTEGYDADGIRKAVAAHIGDKVAAARIADLEKQVADLEERARYRSNF